MFALKLKLGPDTFSSKGATVLEALQKLPVPPKFTAKGIVTLTKGSQKAERYFFPNRLRRLFMNRITQAVWAKNLGMFLK